MPPIKQAHAEPKGAFSHEKKFPRKALPPDKNFCNAREHMRVRRDLARYNRIATQVNSLVDRIESGHESTRALVEWARDNHASLPDSMHAMLRFFSRAHDSTQKEFSEAHTNFVILSEIVGKMSDGAHAKDPSVLAAAIESGKETARLGEILVQTREKLETSIGKLQAKIASAN